MQPHSATHKPTPATTHRSTKVVVTGTRGIPGVMGGVETHCEELFPRIAALGYDVTVIRRSTYVADGLTMWHSVKLVDIDTPRRKAFEAIVHTWRAIWRAKALNADIVHLHAIGPALLTPLARLLGMKVVFTHHGPDYDRDKWGFAAKAMLKLGERMGCMFANEVIVISDVIRNIVKSKYGRVDGVRLIPNGVPQPELCDYPEYFAELGIEKGNYVLAMCRFVPEKRLHDLVSAFASWQGENPARQNIKLVLAGDADFADEYSTKLKAQAQKMGAVLTGFVKGRKLHSLLTNCRCYCLPSSHEGLPIALLEAMSYGVPVVVSDIPANLEVGLPSDCYFKMGDVDSLHQRLCEVLERPAAHVHYDMSKYDWDRIAAQVAEAYDALYPRSNRS